ncbi:MAG: YpjP family protein [Bacillus sp. (in: firmicutes)]
MKFQKWMKKSLVVALSILTFGIVTPDDFIWNDEVEAASLSKKSSFEELASVSDFAVNVPIDSIIEEKSEREKLLESFYEKAETISYQKFGERIKPRIEEEFTNVILPKIEEAIALYVNEYPESELKHLTISEKPASGVGEKIFHIYDHNSGQDLIRFHVRRENVPQQGHWFNFHYHTEQDQFAAHHELGSIYWDTNTPPHWASQTNIV